MILFIINDIVDWGEVRIFLYSNSILVCKSFEKGYRFIFYSYFFIKGI